MRLKELAIRIVHPTERKHTIPAPKPEKTGFTLKDAFEKGKVARGDVLEYRTIGAEKDMRAVYLGPVYLKTAFKGNHMFTEEITDEEQTINTVNFITDWRKVGHRSGHWDDLLKAHFGHNLSSEPLF